MSVRLALFLCEGRWSAAVGETTETRVLLWEFVFALINEIVNRNVIVLIYMWFILILKNTVGVLYCIQHVSCINLQYLFSYVVNLTQNRRQNPLPRHMNYIVAVKFGIKTTAGHHIHVGVIYTIFTRLAHWHSPINAFRSPYGVERTDGSSYRLLLLFNKNRRP